MQANDAMRILGSAAAMGLLGGGGALAYNATTKPILDEYGNVIESNDINPVMAALGGAAIGAVGGGIYGKMNQPVARPPQGMAGADMNIQNEIDDLRNEIAITRQGIDEYKKTRKVPDFRNINDDEFKEFYRNKDTYYIPSWNDRKYINSRMGDIVAREHIEPEVMQTQKIPRQDAEYPYETYWEQSRPDERTPGDPWDDIANAVDEVTDPQKVAQRNAQYEAEFAKKQQAAYQESKQKQALQQETIKRQQAAIDFMEAQGYNTEYGEYRGLVRNEFGELVKPKKPFNYDNYGVKGWDYLETNLVLPTGNLAEVEKRFVPQLSPEQEALYEKVEKRFVPQLSSEQERRGWKYNPNQPTIQVVPASPMQMQNPMARPGMRTVVVQPMKEPGQEMMEEALRLKELAYQQRQQRQMDARLALGAEGWNTTENRWRLTNYPEDRQQNAADWDVINPSPEAASYRRELIPDTNRYRQWHENQLEAQKKMM